MSMVGKPGPFPCPVRERVKIVELREAEGLLMYARSECGRVFVSRAGDDFIELSVITAL